jgi:hypothetical protein
MSGVVDDQPNTRVSSKIYGELDLRDGGNLQCLRRVAAKIAGATGRSILRQTGCALEQWVYRRSRIVMATGGSVQCIGRQVSKLTDSKDLTSSAREPGTPLHCSVALYSTQLQWVWCRVVRPQSRGSVRSTYL